jgi:radical SAM/Cys-rich protein
MAAEALISIHCLAASAAGGCVSQAQNPLLHAGSRDKLPSMDSRPQAEHSFEATLERHGLARLAREAPRTLQVNVGKLCNQACHHCHVDAGPKRTEIMGLGIARRVLEVAAKSASIATVDLTGGAPELNPNFAMLVEGARAIGRDVIVRCNLTVLFERGMEGLAEFYRRNRVELICSLPCYTAENVERQRGRGVFEKSIEALRLLNAAGYGKGGDLSLSLVYNPVGAVLPPAQAELEGSYREELGSHFGVSFDHLITITNMPIARFAHQLEQWGKFGEYMSLLVNHFNPATVDGLMCRRLVSVGYDGTLYDCDFNQMLAMPLLAGGRALTIREVGDLAEFNRRPIAVGSHCFGCSAGAGSSCGGALA